MKTKQHKWRFFKSGRLAQVRLVDGSDIANLKNLDPKLWTVLSCPTTGVRFDMRMLDLMDTDRDGRIRAPEVLGAVEFLESRNVDLNSLFNPSAADEEALASVTERLSDLAKAEPGKDDLKAMAAWEAEGLKPEIKVCGDDTPAADSALAAVESMIDAYFAPPEDMPLVTDAPDKVLPLDISKINPKNQDAVAAFKEKVCARICADAESVDRAAWKKIKAAFAPYRAWVVAKPVPNAAAKADLENQERVLRYKLHLLEFLENYVNMSRLYDGEGQAVYITGTLYIDARAAGLAFDAADAAAHSALAARSGCYLVYAQLTRKGEDAKRTVCVAVTAGGAQSLWAGRNGIFYDRDGKDYDAVIIKTVESQISLKEAFWSPWKKLGNAIASQVQKFLAAKQDASVANVQKAADNAAANAQAPAKAPDSAGNSAALASSVAAIGVGVGMMGAALAGLLGIFTGMPAWKTALAVVCVIFAVSMPSVVITWFKLRSRDLGAILNASGWAVNRPLYFSTALGSVFTKEIALPPAARAARDPFVKRHPVRNAIIFLAIVCAALLYVWRTWGFDWVFAWRNTDKCCARAENAAPAQCADAKQEVKQEVQQPPAGAAAAKQN